MGIRKGSFFVAVLGAAAFLIAPIRGATLDTTTKGNWIGTYGSSGYILPYYHGTNNDQIPLTTDDDIAKLPSYISSYSYGALDDTSEMRGHIWAAATTDLRAPEDPTAVDPLSDGRNANTAYNNSTSSTDPGTITLNLSQPATFNLEVYGLDWDLNGRNVTVSVGADSAFFTTASGYENGVWAIFRITAPAGPLTIDVWQTVQTSNAVISAIAFDPVPEPASIGLLTAASLGVLLRRTRRAQ